MKLPVQQITRQIQPTVGAAPALLPVPGMGGAMSAANDLMQAGAQREQQADQAAQDYRRYELEQAKTRNDERVTNARLQWAETMRARQAEAQDGAPGFTPTIMADFDKWRTESLTGVKDPDEKRMLGGMLENLRGHIGANALEFEAGSRKVYRKRVLSDGIDTDSRVMMADPGQMRDVLAMRLASINSSTDLGAEERAAMAKAARESISFNAGLELSKRDPQGWLRRDPRNDPVTSLMDPGHLVRLNQAAQAELDQRKARAQQGQDKAVREAADALKDLHEFTLDGGVVSPEYEARLSDKIGAVPGLSGQFRTLVDMSRKGAGYATQSLPRQKAALEAFKPGDPEQAKLKAHMQTVTSRQEAAYRENPWRAAEQFGRAAPTPAVKIGSVDALPQLVAQRLGALSGVEVLAGDAQSPIQPEEAQEAAQLLAAAPIEKRAEVLAAMGRQMTPDRLAKLAEQIDKGDRPTALMMMAAGDRTTAGVSVAVRIGQGAQAIKDKAIKIESEAVTGWRSEIANLIRPVMPDAAMAQSAIDAAFYVRAAMETQAWGAEFKGGSNKAAAELVLGRILDRDGIKTLLPRGQEIVDLDKKLLAYTPERLEAMGQLFIAGKPVKAEYVSQRLRTMGLMRDSQGRMIPFHNGAAVTLDKEGVKPLPLEVR